MSGHHQSSNKFYDKNLIEKILQAANHVYGCEDDNCNVSRCRRMKKFFKHKIECKLRMNGCVGCQYFGSIMRVHMEDCEVEHCEICAPLKEYMKSREQELLLQNMEKLKLNTTLNDNDGQ